MPCGQSHYAQTPPILMRWRIPPCWQVKVWQLRYPLHAVNRNLPLQLSPAMAAKEWEELKHDTPWFRSPTTDCWRMNVSERTNCPEEFEHMVGNATAPTAPTGRCVREWQTETNSWFAGRDATKGDCEWACRHERSTWCVAFEFTLDAQGTCKLFDDCSGQPMRQSLRQVTPNANPAALGGCDCKWAGPKACGAQSDDGSRCWGHCCSALSESFHLRGSGPVRG